MNMFFLFQALLHDTLIKNGTVHRGMEYGIVFKFSLPIVYPDDLEFCFETVVSANTTTRTCFLSVNSGDYSTGFGDSVIRRLCQVNFW